MSLGCDEFVTVNDRRDLGDPPWFEGAPLSFSLFVFLMSFSSRVFGPWVVFILRQDKQQQ